MVLGIDPNTNFVYSLRCVQTHLFIVEDKIYRMRMGLFYGILKVKC